MPSSTRLPDYILIKRSNNINELEGTGLVVEGDVRLSETEKSPSPSLLLQSALTLMMWIVINNFLGINELKDQTKSVMVSARNVK